MNAIQQTAQFYQGRGLNLAQELDWYLRHGHVFCSPDRVLMAREIRLDRGMNEWILDGSGDCWYVHWALGKGCMKWFTEQAPKPKEYVAWHRWQDTNRGMLPRLRVFKWVDVVSTVHKQNFMEAK